MTDSSVFLYPVDGYGNPDIIHLHWIGGFVDIPTFFKHVKKPIIWTLHDMNPFQGGFHYKDDVLNYKTYISKFDDRIIEEALKREGLSDVQISNAKEIIEKFLSN